MKKVLKFLTPLELIVKKPNSKITVDNFPLVICEKFIESRSHLIKLRILKFRIYDYQKLMNHKFGIQDSEFNLMST